MSSPDRERTVEPASRPEPLGKTVIDVIDASGVVRERYRFAISKSPITVGRSATCDVTVDDPYVAAMHAILEVTPSGTVRVSDTGSLNGIIVDGTRHRSASGLALPHERMQVGRSTVRVRTSEGDLPAELREQEPPKRRLSHPIVLATLLGLGVAGHAVYERWLAAPQDLLFDAATGSAMVFAVLGGWIAAWSLLTRIIRAEWRFAQHAAIALGIALLYDVVTEATNFAGFVASVHPPGATTALISLAAIGLGLALHLRQASALTTRAVTVAALLVPMILGSGAMLVANRLDRYGFLRSEAALKLYPPNLRLRPAEPVAQFFKRLPDLRARADSRRRDTAQEADE